MKTVEMIYKSYEEQEESNREHLGASGIGNNCKRQIWYSWRWAKKVTNEGRMLKLFERGHRAENVFIRDLKRVGIKVQEKTENGEQFSAYEFGHFSGSIDGMGEGFKESNGLHLLEFKTSKTSDFKSMKKNGVLKTKSVHYDQMQVYMRWFKLVKAFYLMVCKETDELYSEIVKYDEKRALQLLEKAKTIINSDSPPEKISERPSYYECNYCKFKELCHYDAVADVNCRTCAHATPLEKGRCEWKCENRNIKINKEQQVKACENHLFIPSLFNEKIIDANKVENWVEYENFKNGSGEGAVKSIDLKDYLECREKQ